MIMPAPIIVIPAPTMIMPAPIILVPAPIIAMPAPMILVLAPIMIMPALIIVIPAKAGIQGRTWSSKLHGSQKLVGGHHRALTRVDLLGEHAMHIRIPVGTGVG